MAFITISVSFEITIAETSLPIPESAYLTSSSMNSYQDADERFAKRFSRPPLFPRWLRPSIWRPGTRVAGESRRNALCHYQSADLRAKLAAASIAVDAPIGQKALFFGQKRCGETFCSNLFEVRLPNDELTIVCTVSKVDPRCKIRSWLQAWQRAGSSIR
jgi:hypothetical protein